MTTHAIPTRHAPAPLDRHNGAVTEVLEPTPAALIVDVATLLDSRTVSKLVEPRFARRGPHLAVKDGEQTRLLPLEGKIIHLGRGPAADVRIEDHRVSRDHAILVRHGRYMRVLDNRSANGTFINGRQVVATNVCDGDVIRLGPVVFQFKEVG